MSVVLSADANPGTASFVELNALTATPPLTVTDFGVTDVDAGVSLVVVTLAAGGTAQLQLPAGYGTSITLMIVRTDGEATSTLEVLPNAGAQINGAASLTLDDTVTAGGPSAVMLTYDGADWWTSGAT